MSLLLNPRIWIALALAGLLAFTHLSAYRSGRAAVRSAWDATNVATERASQEQAARNRDLQRQSELRYTVAAEVRERFIVQTVREIRDAAAPLATCPIGAAVGVLNSSAACARGDSPSSCGPDEPVPGSR